MSEEKKDEKEEVVIYKPITAQQVLDAQDIELHEVQIPEWKGAVFIRSLSGKERDHFDSIYYNADIPFIEKIKNNRARFLQVVLCDEKGKQLFTHEQIDRLGDKNGAVLDRLYDKAQEISGMRKKDVDKMGKDSSNVKT